LAVGVDTINALDGFAFAVDDFHAFAVAVLWIGKVNAALRIDGDIVGLVVAFSLEAVGEDGDGAVELGSGDAPQHRLAGQEAALGIEKEAIRAGVLAVDARLAIAVELVDVAIAAG